MRCIAVILSLLVACKGMASEVEILALDVIAYDDFVREEAEAMKTLNKALYEKGIVGIRGIPGYQEKMQRFLAAAREFTALEEATKESYAPNRALGETFLGYEKGKERFPRPDGTWVIDDLKTSYYAYVPNNTQNKWPCEVDLKNPFEDVGALMLEIGEAVMQIIGLQTQGIDTEEALRIGRMLYYHKSTPGHGENPFWCGAHFDHGMFTALLPATYFSHRKEVPEPSEAGLFVKVDGTFKKVIADPTVMLFQVGEFGQLATNDAIRATEHRVHKADACLERYAMALFFDAPLETAIHSSSVLTADARYGEGPCTYRQWHEASFNRYIVEQEKESLP